MILPNSGNEHGREGLVGPRPDLHLGDEHATHEHSHAVLATYDRGVVAARQPRHHIITSSDIRSRRRLGLRLMLGRLTWALVLDLGIGPGIRLGPNLGLGGGMAEGPNLGLRIGMGLVPNLGLGLGLSKTK